MRPYICPISSVVAGLDIRIVPYRVFNPKPAPEDERNICIARTVERRGGQEIHRYVVGIITGQVIAVDISACIPGSRVFIITATAQWLAKLPFSLSCPPGIGVKIE